MLRSVVSVVGFASVTGAALAADIPAPVLPPPAPILLAPAPIAHSWTGFYFGGHAGWGFGQSPSADGAVAGGQVGVNWQYDAFVLSAEGDGSWVNWEGADAVGTARLRGGLTFGRFFVYGTGGAAFQSFDDVGWVVGGGGELALTDHWIIGAEVPSITSLTRVRPMSFAGRVSYRFGGGMFGAPAVIMPSTPVAFNWTGFYLGAHGGWSFVDGPDITDGFEVGGQVGVNRQFRGFVAGVEIDQGYVDWGSVTTAGSVRVRAGLAFDRFLPYVAGGMGIEDSIGWTVGGGIEYALTDHWSIGAEYLHHEFFGAHRAELVRGRVNYLFTAGL